jgi:hypothetical protein
MGERKNKTKFVIHPDEYEIKSRENYLNKVF